MDDDVDYFKDQKCLYCKDDLDKEQWASEWDDNHHYKILICPCGRKNWLKVDFPGSGHDAYLKEKESPLESAVRKVREG